MGGQGERVGLRRQGSRQGMEHRGGGGAGGRRGGGGGLGGGDFK